MTLLLDTHTLLWAIGAPTRLGNAAKAAIEDPTTRLVVSAVSPWEMSIKHARGRLPHAELALSNWEAILGRLGAEALAIEADHAILAGRLNWDHRDPFDRMLAAQSVLLGARLVTDDRAFRNAPGVVTLW